MNSKLNIVFFPHSANYGLAGTNRLQNIIYYLRKDTNASIKNIALEDKSKLFDKEGSSLFVKEYKEIYYGPSILDFITHLFTTIQYLYKFREEKSANLIFFYGEVDIKNFFFVLWAKLIGYKIIIDIVEDLETITTYKSFKNKIKYKSAVFFRRRLSFFADAFIVISTHLENKIKTYFPATPTFFLPVTINKELFTASGIKKENSNTKIFYSGSFNEKDGLPLLIEALAAIKKEGKEFTFVLSGRGNPNEMQLFGDMISQYDLKNEVDYKGFLSRDEYVRILAEEADILCMTRINSSFANAGFPFKLGEFLATGKPVIASKVGDVEKYLSEEEAYLTESGNAASIAQALQKIFNDKQAAIDKGIKGKIAAMRYFDHEKYAIPLVNFFYERFETANEEKHMPHSLTTKKYENKTLHPISKT